MALTKADIIDSISSANSITKRQSTDLVESIIRIMKDTLVSGEDLKLAPRRVVTFKFSGKLRERVNGR